MNALRACHLALGSLSILACGACGGSEPPPKAAPAASSASVSAAASSSAPSSSAADTAPAPAPLCLPKAIEKHPLAHVEVVGDQALVCYSPEERVSEGQTYPCLKVDTKATRVIAASSWKAPTAEKAPAAAEPFSLTSTDKEIKVCKTGGKDCWTIKPGYAKPKLSEGEKSGLIAAVSDDGTKVFAIDGEIPKGKNPSLTTSLVVYGDTFDVKTGKRLAHVNLTSTEKAPHVLSDQSDTWSATWIGERVLVSGYRCCGPAGAKELLDPKTGSTLLLGDPQLFEAVDGNTWLLANEGSADQLSVVDVATGKVTAKLSLPNRPLEDGPEQYAIDAIKLPGGGVLVSFANPPGVAVLDVAKPSLSTPLKLPICP